MGVGEPWYVNRLLTVSNVRLAPKPIVAFPSCKISYAVSPGPPAGNAPIEITAPIPPVTKSLIGALANEKNVLVPGFKVLNNVMGSNEPP